MMNVVNVVVLVSLKDIVTVKTMLRTVKDGVVVMRS